MEVLNSAPEHALLNDVVLDNLFEYCKFEELDNCRKVCMKWCQVAEKHWLKKSPVRGIAGPLRNLNVVGNYYDDSWAVNRYNKLVFIRRCFDEYWNVCDEFWKTKGPRIRQLEFCDVSMTSSAAFRGLFYCEETPSLHELKLSLVKFLFQLNKIERRYLDDVSMKAPIKSVRRLEIVYAPSYRRLPCTWQVVFEGYPELEILSLRRYATKKKEELERVFEGLKYFYAKHGYCHPLKRLDVARKVLGDIPGSFPHGMLKAFRQHSQGNGKTKRKNILKDDDGALLRLQTLSFSIETDLDSSIVRELVDYQSNTLRRLKIVGNIRDVYDRRRRTYRLLSESHLDLPPLQYLTRLDIWECHVATFKFLLPCPNLKHLNIIQVEGSVGLKNWRNPLRPDVPGWGMEEKRRLSLPSLISFHCTMEVEWKSEDMLQLGYWMQNVTSLMMVVNDSSFEGLCQGFPKLNSLVIFNYGLTDQVFTGIHSHSPPPPPHLKPNPHTYLHSSNNGPSFERRPNITDLKELQILGVMDGTNMYSHNPRQTLLGEFSVTHGLLQMPSLSTLYLWNEMTSEGLEVLDNNGFKHKISKERPFAFLQNIISTF